MLLLNLLYTYFLIRLKFSLFSKITFSYLHIALAGTLAILDGFFFFFFTVSFSGYLFDVFSAIKINKCIQMWL